MIKESIIISNTASYSRNNEVVSIQRNAFSKKNNGLIPSVRKGNNILSSQTIDANNDGVWDVLLIEVNLPANSKDTLEINWVKVEEQAIFKQFTNVRLSLRSDTNIPSPEINQTQRIRGFVQNIAKPFYQMEGPGIENDKVAFRAFFDYRNGKDIYGKIVNEPVLEQVGVGASWHNLQPWGMDIFHTGNSLGAGGLAVEENKKIYRLGDADTTTFKKLYKGALQAAFKLNFKNWDVAKAKKNGSETVSETKGNFYYRNDIFLALNNHQNLISGIANFGIDQVLYKKHNHQFSSISTYGNQAEGTNTRLGVAIMFSSDNFIESKTSDSLSVIPNTSYVMLKHKSKQTIYFFACWEKSNPLFATQQGFEEYLQQVADTLANPIQIKIINQNIL